MIPHYNILTSKIRVKQNICQQVIQIAYISLYFVSACTSGTYGINCKSNCGKCKTKSCDIFSGNCTDGCADGFVGNLCQERMYYRYSTGKYLFGFPFVINSMYLTTVSGSNLLTERIVFFPFQPMHHHYCDIYYPVNGTAHTNDPFLLIYRSSVYSADSEFCISLYA